MTTDVITHKVDDHTLIKWKCNRVHSDIANISRQTGISRHKVAIALNYGFCTAELRQKIAEYYDKNLPY